jgi:hypothetical protein
VRLLLRNEVAHQVAIELLDNVGTEPFLFRPPTPRLKQSSESFWSGDFDWTGFEGSSRQDVVFSYANRANDIAIDPVNFLSYLSQRLALLRALRLHLPIVPRGRRGLLLFCVRRY